MTGRHFKVTVSKWLQLDFALINNNSHFRTHLHRPTEHAISACGFLSLIKILAFSCWPNSNWPAFSTTMPATLATLLIILIAEPEIKDHN